MVDQFVGKWKLKQSENFDDYMKAIGVTFAIRHVAIALKPDLEFSVDDAGVVFCMKTLSTFKNTELKFKLGEEFDEVTADDRHVKTVVSFENGKLIQKQSWDGKNTTLEREISDGKLKCKCIMGDIVSVRTYEKA